MRIAIEFDDFSPINSRFDLLEKLKEHYPEFKVTMFTVPWEIRYGRNLEESAPITSSKYKPWVDAVKEYEDWIEIAPHGLTHAPMEFAELSANEATKRLIIGTKMFENKGIKYTNLFKAPQWEISKEAKEAIEGMGFIVLEDGYYDWNLAEDLPEEIKNSDKIVIAHGHVQNVCDNGLEEVFHRLMKLPVDTEFYFLSEALKEKQL